MALSERGKIVWFKELTKARKLIDEANARRGEDIPDYKIELDPEDFLDLCNGKWDAMPNDKLRGE